MKTAESCFAPAERAAPETLDRQEDICRRSEVLNHFMEAVPSALVLLNKDRQVVWANRKFIATIGRSWEGIRGRRPGEILDCVNAGGSEGGCGTAELCASCGAVNAILASGNGSQAVRECLILSKETQAYELSVCATPFSLDGEEFTILVLMDISAHKQRELLEKTFLHDLSNTICGLLSVCELFRSRKDTLSADLYRLVETTIHLTDRLVNEIESHREILAAERGNLSVNLAPVSSRELLEQIKDDVVTVEIALGKDILIDPLSEEISFVTDSVLLKRVLGNMMKNALEATAAGGKVYLGCRREAGAEALSFSVRNSAVIEKTVRHQIFRRSFSTKGQGRGIGTYSMKLLGERFLGGQVRFSSAPGQGTTFSIQLPLSLKAAGSPREANSHQGLNPSTREDISLN